MFKRALYHLFIKQTYELRWVIFFLPSFHDTCGSTNPSTRSSDLSSQHVRSGAWSTWSTWGGALYALYALCLKSIRKSCYQNYPMRPCSPSTEGKLAFYIKKVLQKTVRQIHNPRNGWRVECFHNLHLISMLVCALSHFAPFSSL